MMFVLWIDLFLFLCVFYLYILHYRKSFLMFIFLTVLLIYNIIPPLLIPTGIFKNYTTGLNKIGIVPSHIIYYSIVLSIVCIVSIFVGFMISEKFPILVFKKIIIKKIKLNPKLLIYFLLFIVYFINIYLIISGNTNGILKGSNEKLHFSILFYFLNIISSWSGVFSLLLLSFEIDSKMKTYDSYFFIFMTILFNMLTTNTRYYSIIIILGFFYLKYIDNNKKKFLFKFLKISIIVLFFLFIYGYLRTYSIYNLSQKSFFISLKKSNFVESLDFPITYSYYLRTIQELGKKLPYYYGLSLYRVVFMFIPRSIFPSKPLDPSITMMKYLSPGLYNIGVSAGNGFIGESYMNFGVFGIILFGIFYGFFIGILEKYFIKNWHYINKIIYIYIVGLLIEINRGAMSSDIIEFIIICLFPMAIYNIII